ncbi:MAG: GNAT family N-acetyltransferase [Prochloraceae cyanobacterium]
MVLSQKLCEQICRSERDNIPKVYLPNAETWVAEQDDRAIGFISLLGNEVGAIFVHPNYHGQGIGHKLMDKARELRGELIVEVFAANDIGRNFYHKYGFELVEQKVHEQTGLEILRLRLPDNLNVRQ